MDKWVKLNVGGQIFLTTKATLQNEPDSMLSRMFAYETEGMVPSFKDEQGAYMFDRSPKYFEPILNYLRTGKLIIDPNVNAEGILEEAKYYGLQNLIFNNFKDTSDDQTNVPPLTRKEVIEAISTTTTTTELRFQGVNLNGADLSKLDLRHINFKYAQMRGCNLQGANLSHCNLERSDLSKAILDGAQLLGVRMLCANLEGASLQKCNAEDPSTGSIAMMEGVNLKSANIEGSSLVGVNLRVSNLKYANAQNCDLRSAVLAGADLEVVTLHFI